VLGTTARLFLAGAIKKKKEFFHIANKTFAILSLGILKSLK
jgi:hypothetical protein